jgi:hypothetical protein
MAEARRLIANAGTKRAEQLIAKKLEKKNEKPNA